MFRSGGNLDNLLLWLNNSPDILAGYLVHFGEVKEEAENLRIVDVDDHVRLRAV